jgi:DNA-binding transcriptional LysR family regulator
VRPRKRADKAQECAYDLHLCSHSTGTIFTPFCHCARRALARAARAMGVDATTMGRRLRRLEAQVGATLFEQTRDGQVLTERGEALLERVEAMARAVEDRPMGRARGLG